MFEQVYVWFNGTEGMSSLWNCMGQPHGLALVMMTGSLWMIWEYLHYAKRNHVQAGETKFTQHTRELRNVFLQCALIHFLSAVVVWFMPLYWLQACLIWLNAYQCRQLNAAKRLEALEEEFAVGQAAVAACEKMSQILATVPPCHVDGSPEPQTFIVAPADVCVPTITELQGRVNDALSLARELKQDAAYSRCHTQQLMAGSVR